MRKLYLISLVFIFLILPSLSHALGSDEVAITTKSVVLEPMIPFINGDVEKAKHIASVENKNLILIFKTDWDKYSLKLNKILKDEQVVKFLSDFVVVILDSKKDVKVFEKYNIRAYPETLLITQEGVVKGSFRGVIDINNYIAKLKILVSK